MNRDPTYLVDIATTCQTLTWEVTQSSIPELLDFVLPFLPQEEIDNER